MEGVNALDEVSGKGNLSITADGGLSLRDIKIITLACLGVASIIASAIPRVVATRCAKVPYINFVFSLLNTLSGGVILGAVFFHLLPDCSRTLQEHFNEDYPFAGLICSASLFFLWAIDRILLADSNHNHGPSPLVDEKTPLVNRSIEDPNGHQHNINVYTHNEDSSYEHRHNVLDAYVFLIAVSMHSIIEGLGLGAERTEESLFSTIFAIAAHKALEAFALGLTIHRAGFAVVHTLILLLVYSIATPVGGAVGIICDSQNLETARLASGVLLALAAGSFLYISVIELLPTELNRPNSRIRRTWLMLALLCGWAIMALVAHFVHRGHSHDHH